MAGQTIIVGAGPAGLAVAAELGRRNLPYAVLERSDSVGAVWRGRYDSLRLHIRPALEPGLGHLGVLSESGRPRVKGDATVPGYPDLYFVGMREQLAGLLRVIGKQARAVAKAIGR